MLYLLIREEIALIKNNVIEYALIFAYGSLSISKAIYFYSTKFDLFINDENYFILKNLLIFIIGSISVIIVLANLNLNKRKNYSTISLNEIMLLAGGGIYIGTFIFSANIDYRLVFLLLTIPYILSVEKSLVILYSICLIVNFNSLFFEGGDSYSKIYFMKASIIYLMKFAILFLNCYLFGRICSKFISLDFKLLKKFKN